MHQSNRPKSRSWLQPTDQLVPAVLNVHGCGPLFSQSQAPTPQDCRRPRTRAVLPHSPHQSEDELLHRAASVRDFSSPHWRPRRGACSPLGCVGGLKLLGPGNPSGSRHSERLLQDATLGSAMNAISHHCTAEHCSSPECSCWAQR